MFPIKLFKVKPMKKNFYFITPYEKEMLTIRSLHKIHLTVVFCLLRLMAECRTQLLMQVLERTDLKAHTFINN